MIIRCPNCEYSRTININNIPSTAELATCPKCRHRFRFRTLTVALDEEKAAHDTPVYSPPPRAAADGPATPSGSPGLDIWDAVDALNQQWERQLEQHVTEVVTPVPRTAEASHTEEEPSLTAAPQKPVLPSPQAGKHTATQPEAAFRNSFSPPQLASEEPATENNAIPPLEQSNTGAEAESSLDTAPPAPCSSPLPPDARGNPEDGVSSGAAADADAAAATDLQTPAIPAGATPVFPYADDDTTPEERVERDLLLLRGSGDRPTRDLGRLDDHGTTGGGNDREPETAPGDIPWEMPEKYGWLQAFIKTIHEVMFNAPAFFSRLRPSGSLASEYLFFLLLGYVAILGSVLWARVALYLIPSLREDAGSDLSLPAMLLLAPLALGLMQVFVTGGIRLIQQIFSSEQADFSLVFKVVSYAVAPFVLSVVPFVGPVVGAIWFLASLFIGCRHGLGLSWRLAVAVPLLPALILIYGVAWYFL